VGVGGLRSCGSRARRPVPQPDTERLGKLHRSKLGEVPASMAVRETATALQVEDSESASAGDLKSYLESAECAVQVVGTHTLEVSIPRVPFGAQALRVLTL
jgi:hypothetical protein